MHPLALACALALSSPALAWDDAPPAEEPTPAEVPAEAPAAAEEPTLSKRAQRRADRRERYVERIRSRRGLEAPGADESHALQVRYAMRTRNSGRRATAAGASLLGLGGVGIVGGVAIATGFCGTGDGWTCLAGAILGALPIAAGAVMTTVGAPVLGAGIGLRESGKSHLRDLGQDPKLRTVPPLEITLAPVLVPQGGGFVVGVRFP